MEETIHLIISGKVQGVFYRASARDKAEEIGVFGWVKNTAAGDVEIIASGTEDRLQEFIQWCRQGPPDSVVTDVTVFDLPELKFDRFTIHR